MDLESYKRVNTENQISVLKMSFLLLGAHAEFTKVPASRLVKIPSEVSFEQAATAMIQGMTAHYLVYTTGRLKPGDKVLIHAAAGGTGSLVCQVAKNAGNLQCQVNN